MTRARLRQLTGRLEGRIVWHPYDAAGVRWGDENLESLAHEAAHWVTFPAPVRERLEGALAEGRKLTELIGQTCEPQCHSVKNIWEADALAAEILFLRPARGVLEDEALFLRSCLAMQGLEGWYRSVRCRMGKPRAEANARAIGRQLRAWAEWPAI